MGVFTDLLGGKTEHVKAILIGEGADELFAGYSHYGRHESAEALHEELLETIGGLHIGGLQRFDRLRARAASRPGFRSSIST